MTALDRKLLRDLRTLRAQVSTIALVVGAGISAFVALQSAWTSLHESRGTFYEQFRFADAFVSLEHAPESVARRLRDIPGVALVETRVVDSVRIPLTGARQPPIGQIVAIPDEGPPALNALRLSRGRLPIAAALDEAVLLEKFAQKQGVEVGDVLPVIVRGVQRSIRIVGIATSPEYIYVVPLGDMAPDESRFAVLWMGRDAAARLLDLEGAFNDAVFKLEPGAALERVLADIDRILTPWGGLGAVGREFQPSNFVLEGEMEQLRSLATVVPFLFLSVAAFLLNVVLSRLVLLQRGQIAVLKAVGYSDLGVGIHYLKLVLVVVLLGAGLGIGLGAFLGDRLTRLYSDVFGFPEHVFLLGSRVVGWSIAISTGAALLGAFVTIRQIVALPPAEAMRPAPPGDYRPTVLERIGFARTLSPAARMVLRELERRPMRVALSVAGLSMAIAILVCGRFYLDAVDWLVDLQFNRVSREDLAVSFDRPVPMRAVHELASMPGVMQAESMRLVPVRFRKGNRWRDGALVGYGEQPDLRRPLDIEHRPVRLPIHGVVLSQTLAEVLGVVPGDEVDLEVREGDRAHRRVTIAGLSNEVVGLQGHARLDELLRILREQDGVSSVLLRVQQEALERVEARLADMSAVSSVTSRAVARARLVEQMGKTVVVMTMIVTIFAATIAVGVVYNDARIVLAVRSRDLASLRVLGLTRREISEVLLGELAVEGALALVPGLVFGRFLAGLIAGSSHPERLKLPVVVSDETYAFAVTVALVAGIASALLVRRRLDHLDLVEVLKARE